MQSAPRDDSAYRRNQPRLDSLTQANEPSAATWSASECRGRSGWQRWTPEASLLVQPREQVVIVGVRRMRAGGELSCQKGIQNQAIGRSRGGLTTKIHIAVDALGNPLRLIAVHDSTQAEALGRRLRRRSRHCRQGLRYQSIQRLSHDPRRCRDPLSRIAQRADPSRMMMSLTRELTILPKAAPTITPTVRSITLPRIANSRNSYIMAAPVSLRKASRPSATTGTIRVLLKGLVREPYGQSPRTELI